MDEDERTTPIGLFNFAHSYWRSAITLQGQKVNASHPSEPVSFLYIHALELYLKAFLRLKGLSVKDLRKKYGHKLCCLSQAAQPLGFQFAEEDMEILSVIACLDIIDYRYIKTGGFHRPTNEALDRTCKSFHEQVETGLRSSGIATRRYAD